MQIGMSFIGAYKMCAGEAAVADLAFAAKHAGVIQMADILPARRARGPNEPGGIKFGHFGDMIQADRKYPNDPVKATLESRRCRCDALRPDLARILHVRWCRVHPVCNRCIHRQHPR